MNGDPHRSEDSRLPLDRVASSPDFWRFYRAFTVLAIFASWITAPFLAFDALLRRDYGAAAFAVAALAAGTLGGLFLVRIANWALRKRATQDARRMV